LILWGKIQIQLYIRSYQFFLKVLKILFVEQKPSFEMGVLLALSERLTLHI